MKNRKTPTFATPAECPQAGLERMIMPQPIATLDPAHPSPERELMRHMYKDGAVFMMGQNPDLPVMPKKPRLPWCSPLCSGLSIVAHSAGVSTIATSTDSAIAETIVAVNWR